jgi:CHAD domain-containing protein
VEQLEVERTYAVPEGFVLPDLSTLPAVAGVDEPVTYSLEAGYVDTADLRLLRAGTTLRRRTGGADDGWHLKLPMPGGDRLEVHRPSGRVGSTPPVALRRLVTAYSAGSPLTTVATLRTDRTVWTLRDASGSVLAEVCLDEVAAALPDEPTPRVWTELEVELGADVDRSVADAIEERLLDVGVTVSAHPSKLRRALGEVPGLPAYDSNSARGVVLAQLAELVETLAAWDVALRRDQPRAVHQSRVTIRRIRSVLAVSRRLLDREQTDEVRRALADLAGVLGDVRDDEVLRANLTALLDAEVPGGAAVRRRLLSALASTEREHRTTLRRELDGDANVQMWASLRALVEEPPLTERSSVPPRRELARAVGKAWGRLDRDSGAMFALPQGADREAALHEVRKAGKRLRYALDMAGPVLDRAAAEKMTLRLKAFQEYAGTLRDDQLAMLRTAELADQLPSAAFSLGHLHGVLRSRVLRAEESAAAEARRLSAPKLRKKLTG